MLTPKTN
jgi:hypothetical protein